MKLVLDTNVVVSAIVWGGLPARLLDLADDGAVNLIASETMLQELGIVLRRPHLADRKTARSVRAESAFERVVVRVADMTLSAPVSRDPKDDMVLAAALEGKADLIVSGDKDLLVLGSYAGIPIVSPSQAVARLAH